MCPKLVLGSKYAQLKEKSTRFGFGEGSQLGILAINSSSDHIAALRPNALDSIYEC